MRTNIIKAGDSRSAWRHVRIRREIVDAVGTNDNAWADSEHFKTSLSGCEMTSVGGVADTAPTTATAAITAFETIAISLHCELTRDQEIQ